MGVHCFAASLWQTSIVSYTWQQSIQHWPPHFTLFPLFFFCVAQNVPLLTSAIFPIIASSSASHTVSSISVVNAHSFTFHEERKNKISCRNSSTLKRLLLAKKMDSIYSFPSFSQSINIHAKKRKSNNATVYPKVCRKYGKDTFSPFIILFCLSI